VAVQLSNVVSNATTSGPTTTYTVLTASPTLAGVACATGQSLALTWTAPSGNAACTAFLQPATGPVLSQASTSGTTTFTPLTAGVTYTASVCATSTDGVSVGPPSTTYTAITSAPTMTAVVNTGAGLALTWQSLAGCTGYQASQQVAGSPVTTVAVTGTAYTFNSPVSISNATTCWVSATGGGGVVTGPPTPVYTALVGQPKWVQVAYNAGQMSLSWTAVSDATANGYAITVQGLTQPAYSVGKVTATTIAATLTALTSYPTSIVATNGVVQGPPSPTLIPLTAPPKAPLLGYTGSKLQLAWSPSGESNVTGYATQLLSNAVSPENTTASQSPQQYATAFGAGIVFTACVRASGPGTLGPWSASVTGPYQSNIIYAYDALGRIATITRAAGFTETYGFDSAGNLLSAAYATSTS